MINTDIKVIHKTPDLTCKEVGCIHTSKTESEYKVHQIWHRLDKEQRENQEREGGD